MERGRGIAGERERELERSDLEGVVSVPEGRVCVCEREREGERESSREETSKATAWWAFSRAVASSSPHSLNTCPPSPHGINMPQSGYLSVPVKGHTMCTTCCDWVVDTHTTPDRNTYTPSPHGISTHGMSDRNTSAHLSRLHGTLAPRDHHPSPCDRHTGLAR